MLYFGGKSICINIERPMPDLTKSKTEIELSFKQTQWKQLKKLKWFCLIFAPGKGRLRDPLTGFRVGDVQFVTQSNVVPKMNQINVLEYTIKTKTF